jgi:hypothetical protein
MKNVNLKLMALAGTLAIAATTVYAQNTMTLKASIPFSFQVGSRLELQPGDYLISRSGAVWTFLNAGTSEKALSIPASPVYGESSETAQLVFECRDNASHCALRTVHAGGGAPGGYWPSPKGKANANEEARIVVVPVTVSAE